MNFTTYHLHDEIGLRKFCNFNGDNDQILEGPTLIFYYKNLKLLTESYWFNGMNHNPYGPAVIDYHANFIRWYFNGHDYTNEVKEYLNINNLNYKTMTQTDFDIMWMNIL